MQPHLTLHRVLYGVHCQTQERELELDELQEQLLQQQRELHDCKLAQQRGSMDVEMRSRWGLLRLLFAPLPCPSLST